MSETADAPKIDYVAMADGDLLQELGDDASKWADAFCQYAANLGIVGIDEGWMITWFANAIEHSTNVRHHRGRPATLPVISDFKWSRSTRN